jgi:hypothetical protein
VKQAVTDNVVTRHSLLQYEPNFPGAFAVV